MEVKAHLLPLLLCALVACRTGDRSGVRKSDAFQEAALSRAPDADPQRSSEVWPQDSRVFPLIQPQYNGFHLKVIEAYCQRHGLARLGRESIRMFVQPSGIVEGAIEIDLGRRRVTVYPDWWTNPKEAYTIGLRREDREDVRALVTSDEFRRIPAEPIENLNLGMDGCAYLIESTVGGHYLWKLHWESEDPVFVKARQRLGALRPSQKPE
jgi:hypothetical protein